MMPWSKLNFRRSLVVLLLMVAPIAQGADAPTVLRWVSGTDLEIEGKGWSNTKFPFDRLPAHAEGVVRGQVFSLGRDSAGLALRFASNTSDNLLGHDNDATVDGSHPTDLGFTRIADEMTPLLRQVLAGR